MCKYSLATFGSSMPPFRPDAPFPTSFANDHMQHAHQEGQISAWPHWQIQIGITRNGSKSRICHDQPGPLVAGTPDVIGSDGGTLSDIGADDEEDFSFESSVPA
jgi:hypothetical protein